MKEVYEKCSILENDNYLLRLVEIKDVPGKKFDIRKAYL